MGNAAVIGTSAHLNNLAIAPENVSHQDRCAASCFRPSRCHAIEPRALTLVRVFPATRHPALCLQTMKGRIQRPGLDLKADLRRSAGSDAQKAERLNRARMLLQESGQLPEAIERLARECSISPRQAYGYLRQASELKKPIAV